MTPETFTPSFGLARGRTPLVLLALALFLLLARIPSYSEPIEWDLGMYTAIAGEMRHGERLYADAWDMKPPAIFATFAAMQSLAGDGFLSIYLLSVIAAIVTMLAVYHAASVAGATAGLWAAAFWAAMAFDPWTGGDRPNTEAFMNAAIAWAFALWVRTEGRRAWGRWIGIALLFAVASMYKHVAVAPAVCMAVVEVVFPHAGEPRWRGMTRVALMAGVGFLAWAALFAYFAATGRAWIFWQTMFVYPRAYSGSMIDNVLASWPAVRTMSRYMAFATPTIVLTLIAVLARTRAAPRRAWLLHAGLFVGTYFAVALPGSFLSHYFQLWFAPLAIGAGWGAAWLSRVVGLRSPRLATAAIVLALVVILYPQLTFLSLNGRERARRKYGDFFIYAHDAGRAADQLLLPGETFFTWSEETYVYPVAHRRPPATGLWREHMLTGPLAEWLTRRTLEDLQRDPPELYLHWGAPLELDADHPIPRWAREHYDPLPGWNRKHFPMYFYVRNGGALEKRLMAPSTEPSPAMPS
ncbi:MAG: glycosyltransferase family 39 protein [Planctomycetota bacterium]|nr:glycosyltransferase family 39 protein [Planctomycetota bacterium]